MFYFLSSISADVGVRTASVKAILELLCNRYSLERKLKADKQTLLRIWARDSSTISRILRTLRDIPNPDERIRKVRREILGIVVKASMD